MKLRYYLSGLGSGIIIAVLIMLIADKVTAVNNNVNGSNVPQETTGSVIAYNRIKIMKQYRLKAQNIQRIRVTKIQHQLIQQRIR